MGRRSTTPSEENYIEWLYRFSLTGPVRLTDLAEKLGVKRPSVSRAVAGLVKKGLARHERYGELELTEAGIALGRDVVRRDDCLTALLVEVLNMPLEQADAEVHRLEHVLGDDVLLRLEALLELATSSKAWLKRLHHRIACKGIESSREKEYLVGNTPTHSGLSREKTEKT